MEFFDNALIEALTKGVKVYSRKDWWVQYGRVWLLLNLLLYALTACFSNNIYSYFLSLLISILSLIITLKYFQRLSNDRFRIVLLWARESWREIERWKQEGIEEIEKNLDVECVRIMCNVRKRYGTQVWDFLIEYCKEIETEKLKEGK